MKKIKLSIFIFALLMPILTANAAYNTVTPTDTSIQPSGRIDYYNWRYGYNTDYNVLTPSGSASDLRNRNNNSGYNIVTPSDTTENTNDNKSGYNTVYPSGSASDLREQSTKDDEAPATDPDDKYKETYVTNSRDYCVGDTCWVIYDECYDPTHCWEKKEEHPRDEYDPEYNPEDQNYTRNRGDTWNYWINYYVNNYYFYGFPMCDSRYQKCVYRGFHFGGNNNGYWPSFY